LTFLAMHCTLRGSQNEKDFHVLLGLYAAFIADTMLERYY